MRKTLTIIALLILSLTAIAQSPRGPVRHVQSDGRTVSYVAVGTKPDYYAQTLDGYTLWHTETGDIVYATTDSEGQMVPSTVLAADERTADEQAFLSTVQKGLRFRAMPRPLMAGHLLGGSHFPHEATQQDSLLVILVQFQDVQFTNPAATFDSLFSQPNYNGTGSFRDYYYDQSGGSFNPGVRVVGPITMPHNKNNYNQTSPFISYARGMVSEAISQSDQYVDYSHFDNDNNGTVDAVLVFYAGESPTSKTQGLWPHKATISTAGVRDGKTFSSYAIFDEGDGGVPAIGTVCHEFGHCLGLPDLYDVAHDGTSQEGGRTPEEFSLMAYGNYNYGGKLPPNLSVLEKSLLGWGAQFDTLQPGDSITLRAIGTASDRAWYLPIDGNEFYAFEVRSGANHWDAGIGMGEGGLVVYHGKESKLNTTSNSVINCTIGDEGWYVVDAWGNNWAHSSSYFGGDSNPRYFSPFSLANPMKNDSTMVDSIWITNIRWTSDTTMAFSYSKTRPNYAIVENVFNNGTDVTDSGFTARALVIGYADTLLAKGIVYASTAEGCTMEQGTVVYDTTLSHDDSIQVAVGGITTGSWWFRAFVQDSNGITLTKPQKVITPLVKVDSVVSYLDSIFLQGDTGVYLDTVLTKYIPYVSLAGNCSIVYFGSPYNLDNIPGKYATQTLSRHDVSGPLGAEELTMLNAVSTDGDTVSYAFDLSVGAVMRETPIQGTQWLAESSDIHSINGNLVAAKCMLTLPHEMASTHSVDMVTIIPNDTLQAWIEYYGPMGNNNSFVQHLLAYSVDTNFSLGDTAFLPSGDSTLVVVWNSEFGIKRYGLYSSIIIAQDSTNESPGASIYSTPNTGYRYCTDSTLNIDFSETHHFSILYGKHSELTALGVTDTATAAAYCMAHPDQVASYEQFSVSYRTRNADFTIDELHIPDFVPATNYFTNLYNSDSGQYDMYIVLFDFEGHCGDIVHEQFTVLCNEMGIKIEPGVSYLPYDTTWLHIEAGQPVWKWHYDWGWDLLYMPIDSMYSSVLLAGELDNIMTTYGMDENSIMSLLRQQGRLSADNYLVNEDTAGLTTDTIYEVCLWVTVKNEETEWKDTLLLRRTFSTHVPTEMINKAKVIGIEKDQSNGCWINCNINTAYVKTVFGTLEQLLNAGITSMAAARDYLESGGSLVQSLSIMGSGNTSNYTYASCNITSGQYYRLYVFPYDIDSIAGYGRMIGIDNRPESLPDCFTDAASDISTTSANIHGHLSRSDFVFGDNYNGIRTKVGFFWREASASDFDTILVSEWDTTLNYTLSGLRPNTEYVVRAFYDHYGNYFNGNWSWGDITFYSQNEITFTTAQCTVSASIDTTICYNDYYGATRYTASQTLEYTYTAANSCDSILTVNLNVLPQRIGYDTVVLCYGEAFDSQNRYSSTTVNQTIVDDEACDSTLILYLRVLPAIATYFTDTLRGDSYAWDNDVYTAAGVYQHTYTAANGCDSTVTLTLVAEPETPHDGIGDVDNAETSITVDGHIITVTCREGIPVTVYDAIGRLLATRRDAIRFEAPAAGTYFVQIGTLPTRKVVVVR